MGSRKKKGLDINGWLILDKPTGLGSTQALGRAKRIFTPKKAGHAGTLDPLATGILPIAFGEATKTVPFAVDGEKQYRFDVTWGTQTNTDDTEGNPIETSELRPDATAIEVILPDFTGALSQVPPQFSAVKVDGARAYDLARGGAQLELKARDVTILSIKIVEHSAQKGFTSFEVACTKGTYVRALARDMGQKLGCFGHISKLRRTRVGRFQERDTISLDKLEELRHSAGVEGLSRVLLPVETVLDDIPALEVGKTDAARLKRGQSVLIRGPAMEVSQGPIYVMSGGALVALGEIRQGAVHPNRIFHL